MQSPTESDILLCLTLVGATFPNKKLTDGKGKPTPIHLKYFDKIAQIPIGQ